MCWVIPSGGNSKESATENIPPGAGFQLMVRVKRCGKSAPLEQRCSRHGKPHTEQGQIGERLNVARMKLPGRLLKASGNRRLR